MPTKLDAHRVADALSTLPGWSGDTSTIVRRVAMDEETANEAVEKISIVANEMNHHPVVDRAPGVTIFTVWTHSQGGVTDLDIALASRISDILRQHGIADPSDAGT
ncbi:MULTISPECIES: 4a-hydroxytetrahydrobiopterin dehydratase [Protofrankia]|uniref:Putative pterin-4-alpha-carbinolamine dehydratase n=1 Tax=Candidatus Protofrankia datiscae TaxID=2716812 RepID=F8AWE1_9ACTN|nr:MULTISPECIES: 4a-hydroxytetrahydrobiopterin dehydratase [Protofrankia]AEH08342.1 putative pterin-4-alpha-carbinolamine dehydratase [Candidatus Protofrankia datiscae]